MFHPMVAGVTIPGMGLFGLILAPYIDRNPSNKPEDRKFAISLFTDLPDVLGGARHHRLVLPGPGLQTSSSRGTTASSSTSEVAPCTPCTVLVIAIPVLVVLAVALMLFSSLPARDSRRGDRRAEPGRPASATAAAVAPVRLAEPRHDRPRGRARPPQLARDAAASSSPVGEPAPPAPCVPPDPEALGVTRRQFLNRGIVGVLRPRPRPASAPPCSAFLWPQVERRLRLEDQRRQARPTSSRRSSEGSGFAYYPEGRMWVTPLSRRRARQGQEGVLGARAGRHGGRRRGAVPEVRAPRLPRAVVPHLAVVRVPVPRLAVQPGR